MLFSLPSILAIDISKFNKFDLYSYETVTSLLFSGDCGTNKAGKKKACKNWYEN